MGKVVQSLFGGGDDAAQAAAERSRKMQQVANDRQLAQATREEGASAVSRRAPRGRRLFEKVSEGLKSTLGG